MWKPLEKANFRAAEILKENHAFFIIAMRGKLERLQHRDWSNLCLAKKIILWEEFGDVFMSALTLRQTIHPSFSGLLLLVFPFTREKLFALDALHTVLKMKSSETYINRQASPKVVFVPNWSDFRLDCQFMLHVTHVPKAPLLPHTVPKRGTRKQTSTVCTFSFLPSHLFSSNMAGQGPAFPGQTTNSVRVNWKLSKPRNTKGPEGHSETHCHSVDLERKMSELLIELMSQTDQKINPLLRSHFLSWAGVENPSDSLLSLLAPFCLLQRLPGTSCSSSSLLACTSGTSQWCRKPALNSLSM